MKDKENPLGIKVLMIYEGLNDNTAAARAVRTLKTDLEAKDVKVEVSESMGDAKAVLVTDPTVQCVLLKLDDKNDKDYVNTIRLLEVLRSRNKDVPVF